ncbi:MAG: class I SAM-dependent methyltransferase [Patescibacteria group bacterium]
MKKQYDDIAKEYAGIRNITQRFVIGPTLFKMSGQVRGKSLLDLGCGEGYYTRLFAHKNPSKIVGMDISKRMIALAKRNKDATTAKIEYVVGDIANIRLRDQFDIVTAVYALNYAETEEVLSRMCEHAFDHLKKAGRFCIITLTPKLKPRKMFIRMNRFLHPNNKEQFSNGDRVMCEVRNPDSGKVSAFTCYYWDEKTYSNALKGAGFDSVEWIYDMSISKEGAKRFGKSFWNKWRQTKVAVGISAMKK